MSGLREKAKTLVEIIQKGCPYVYITRCKDCIGRCEFVDTESFAGLWVMLDDVEELEQKVKNLETDRDNLLKSLHTYTQNLNSYAKESVELKQKLQQLLEDMRKIPEKRLPLNQTTWLQEISVWKHQIEELLQEISLWEHQIKELLKEEMVKP
jgi:chromosome segregation ATPase